VPRCLSSVRVDQTYQLLSLSFFSPSPCANINVSAASAPPRADGPPPFSLTITLRVSLFPECSRNLAPFFFSQVVALFLESPALSDVFRLDPFHGMSTLFPSGGHWVLFLVTVTSPLRQYRPILTLFFPADLHLSPS